MDSYKRMILQVSVKALMTEIKSDCRQVFLPSIACRIDQHCKLKIIKFIYFIYILFTFVYT